MTIFANVKRVMIMLCAALLIQGCKDRCVRVDGPLERFEQAHTPLFQFALETPARVVIFQDSTEQSALEIYAQPVVYQALKVDVKGGTCTVSQTECFKDQEELNIQATMRQVRRIISQSAGEITSGNAWHIDTISFENTGLGDIDCVVKAGQVTSHATASGNIILSGSAARSVCLSSGSGEISQFNLIADTVEVHTIGSGVIQVHAEHYLKVHFWNPATVLYRGHPDSIIVSGEGEVRDANL
jgi:hypothetical protein